MNKFALMTVIYCKFLPLFSQDARMWHRFESSCYAIVTEKECVGVFECSQYCSSLKSHLVEIETFVELSFLRQIIDDGDNAQYWIGVEYNGTDKHNGVHRWINSKQVVDSSLYRPGEPNYYVDSCARLHTENHVYWIDVRGYKFKNCTDKYRAICERAIQSRDFVVGFSLTTMTSSQVCQLEDVVVDSIIQCARRCAMTPGGIGFHYNGKDSRCVLYGSSVSTCAASVAVISEFYQIQDHPCDL